MAVVPTREGEMEDLKDVLGKGLMLRLFVNDIDPEYEHGVADFEELDKSLYTAEVLRSTQWQLSLSEEGIPMAVYPEVTFTFTEPGAAVYGYYVTDKNGTVARWAERFEGERVPYNVLREGDVIYVTPKLERKK